MSLSSIGAPNGGAASFRETYVLDECFSSAVLSADGVMADNGLRTRRDMGLSLTVASLLLRCEVSPQDATGLGDT